MEPILGDGYRRGLHPGPLLQSSASTTRSMDVKRTALILLLAACAGTQTPDPEAITDGAADATPEPAPEVAPSVDPVPEGFHTLTPVLIVDDIEGAVEYYTKALGAEHRYTTDGPDGEPLIAQIKIGDSVVMLSPENEERRQRSPKTMEGSNGSLHVYVSDVDATFAGAIEAGGTERIAVADVWWGDRFGELLDPFGHRWSLATH
ncbi:MAG TPA: VOC family protein, partial [Deltaproteobacteria bacterium]|nr:VOC family protein [Deltaproteobacteria bacterium]